MPLKINQMAKETPLNPNVLLAQTVELEGECHKMITDKVWISLQTDSEKLKKNSLKRNNTYKSLQNGF